MFRVQRKRCTTCIYRKSSPLDLAKLEAAIADPHMADFFADYRVCHHSTDACCRGFWDRHRDACAITQIAKRLGLVAYVDEDTLAL